MNSEFSKRSSSANNRFKRSARTIYKHSMSLRGSRRISVMMVRIRPRPTHAEQFRQFVCTELGSLDRRN
jgi:hypothetical protein